MIARMQDVLDSLSDERRLPGDRMRDRGEHHDRRPARARVGADPGPGGIRGAARLGDELRAPRTRSAIRGRAPATTCACRSARRTSAGSWRSSSTTRGATSSGPASPASSSGAGCGSAPTSGEQDPADDADLLRRSGRAARHDRRAAVGPQVGASVRRSLENVKREAEGTERPGRRAARGCRRACCTSSATCGSWPGPGWWRRCGPTGSARIALIGARWGASPAAGVLVGAIRHPDRTMIIDELGLAHLCRGRPALERARQRAAAAEGIEAGDRVGLMCRDHRGFVEGAIGGGQARRRRAAAQHLVRRAAADRGLRARGGGRADLRRGVRRARPRRPVASGCGLVVWHETDAGDGASRRSAT